MADFPLSIIVPVYNDEKNLPRCVESILSQTFNNFECLLIDDGSTDNCPLICDNFAKKDGRIRVYHKNNEGISKTRQFGIDNAIGSYTVFIDSDDRIDARFFFNIMQIIYNEKHEIIFMDFWEENYLGIELYNNQKPPDTETDTILKLVLEGVLRGCLWNVIIKKNLYKQNNIGFIDSINYGEDTLFILELLLNNPVVGYLPGAYYHHSFNRNSFTRQNQKKRFIERIKFLNYVPLLLSKKNREDLNDHNFFPLNDKYEMFCSGVFSRKEYYNLFPVSFTPYFKEQTGFRKYFLLNMAEKKFYILARFIDCILQKRSELFHK